MQGARWSRVYAGKLIPSVEFPASFIDAKPWDCT